MTTTNPHLVKKSSFSTNLYNEFILLLAVLQMFLAQTIPSLKKFQMPIELLLLALLFYAFSKYKYDKSQMLLFLLFVAVTAASFLTTPKIQDFLVNTKQNSLGVLSLLYFSKVEHKSKIILPVFLLTLSLLILNFISPSLVSPLIQITFNKINNLSRFGGFFLNVHYNGFFIAIALIYYGYKRRLYGLGAYTVFFSRSRFVFAAYMMNLLFKLKLINSLIKYKIILIIAALVGIYGVYEYQDEIFTFFNTPRLGSAAIIFIQFLDPAYYKPLLNPFPTSYINVQAEAINVLQHRHNGQNEIGFLAMAMHQGMIFGLFYLYMLLKVARNYRVFILVTLLHNFYILSPLTLYMMVNYSREIDRMNLAKNKSIVIGKKV